MPTTPRRRASDWYDLYYWREKSDSYEYAARHADSIAISLLETDSLPPDRREGVEGHLAGILAEIVAKSTLNLLLPKRPHTLTGFADDRHQGPDIFAWNNRGTGVMAPLQVKSNEGKCENLAKRHLQFGSIPMLNIWLSRDIIGTSRIIEAQRNGEFQKPDTIAYDLLVGSYSNSGLAQCLNQQFMTFAGQRTWETFRGIPEYIKGISSASAALIPRQLC